MDLAQTLYHTSIRWPRNIAIVDKDNIFTYEDWNCEVNKFAYMLNGMGVKQGDRIATFMFNCWELVTIALATQKIGVVLVPLNYRLSSGEIKYIINDCGAKGLIFKGWLADYRGHR